MAADDITGARCDIRSRAPSFRSVPPGCEPDGGDRFEIIPEAGHGVLFCHGDTVVTPDSPVLDHGLTVDHAGMTCTSAETAIICTNAAGLGFSPSRSRQQQL